MRQILVSVMLALVSMRAYAQEVAKPALSEYVSPEMGITLHFPKSWGIEKMDPEGLMLSPGMHEWADTAVPPAPHPWLILITPVAGTCERDTRAPYPISFDDKKGYAQVSICKKGFFAAIGYRGADPQREEHVRELYQILDSIEKTRSR